MSGKLQRISFILILFSYLASGPSLEAEAFTYQGRLEQDGVAVTGSYDLLFELFDDAAGSGSPLETLSLCAVQIESGAFTVPLDFGDVFDGGDLWLAVGVAEAGPCNGSTTYTPLSPLQPITPAPYAHYAHASGDAETLDGVDSSAFLTSDPGGGLVLGGLLQLQSGGIEFPDGTVQTSAAASDAHSLDAADGDPTDVVFVDAEGDVSVNDVLFTAPDSDGAWEINSVANTEVADLVIGGLGEDTVFVAYEDDSSNDLRFARSVDGGRTWKNRQLNLGARPAVSAAGGRIYVCFILNGSVWVSRTTDLGETWLHSVIGPVGGGSPGFGAIAVHAVTADIAHVIFRGSSGPTLASTGNGGANWGLSPLTGVSIATPFSIFALDAVTVMVTGRAAGLKLARTDNAGVTWTQATIDGSTPFGRRDSLYAVSSQTLYVSYRAGTSSVPQLGIAKSTDGGSSWSTTTVDGGGTYSGLEVFDPSSLAVAYSFDDDGTKYATSVDGGTTWETAIVDDARSFEGIALYSTSFANNYVAYYPSFGGPFVARNDPTENSVGVGTSDPQSELQVIGYLQVGTSGSYPPQADCNEESEIGRMKVNDAGDLYLCSRAGWIIK